MSSPDALSAAKAAALLDLTQSVPPPPSRRRRRRRRRPIRQPSPIPLEAHDASTDIQYEAESLTSILPSTPLDEGHTREITRVFDTFTSLGRGTGPDTPPPEEANLEAAARSDDDAQNVVDEGVVLSRRKIKEGRSNLIWRLKSVCSAPEVVEAWDVSAMDSVLLTHLKTWRGSVCVPSNWRQKRKYLQNKRGMEKRAFQMPAYIADTGIGEIRDAQNERDDKKSLKQRQRERMRAKTRAVEIEESRLHDAFFKFQTRPKLTGHGDVYYELRELEVDGKRFRPMRMSEGLMAALGIRQGEPVPWLVNMQRFGPPPGWPGLVVPGVNARIPAGGRFGYQEGGWGKPPVDEMGRPIYGDVFGEGLVFDGGDDRFDLTEEQREWKWGEMTADGGGMAEERGEEEKEEEEEGEGETEELGGRVVVDKVDVVTTKVAVVSDARAEAETETRKGLDDGKLYAVLPQRRAEIADNLMASAHVYDIAVDKPGEEGDANGSHKRRREEGQRNLEKSNTSGKKPREFKF